MPFLKFVFFLLVMLLLMVALASAYAVAAGGGAMLVFLWYFWIYAVPAFVVLLFLVIGVSVLVAHHSVKRAQSAGTPQAKRQKIGRACVFAGLAFALLGLLWRGPENLVHLMETESKYALVVVAVILRDVLPGLLLVLLGYLLQKPVSSNPI